MNTVLIVDDEDSIQTVTSAILSKQGYRTVGACTADEAERAIDSGEVDVALVDVVLPGRGGIDLLMEIKEKHPSLPVIVMSGKVSTDAEPFKKLASQFGAKCIISKPFTSEDLVTCVESVLNEGCA